MIEEPTCLILGAGASAPYGLPTAEELKNLILAEVSEGGREAADKYPVRNPPRVVSMGRSHHRAHEWGAYLRNTAREVGLEDLVDGFWEKLRGSPRGIDWFLRNNPDYERLAKLHISAVLLNRETPPGPFGDWYQELARQVLTTHERAFTVGLLSIVTFNYDRSLERFFLNALTSDYGLSDELAETELAKVRIEHVYGKLGELSTVPYGDFQFAERASEGISLTRATLDEEIQERVRPLLEAATYINFIGFSFDQDNLAVLGGDGFKGKRVCATSRGLSFHDKKRAREQLGARFSSKHPDWDALDFLRNLDIFGPKKQAKTKRPSSYPRPSSDGRRWIEPRRGWMDL